jgi:hypothetical protein
MSGRVCGDDNRTTDNGLSYTLQSACSFSLGGNNELMRQEPHQRNEHEQSVESSQSNKCTCDPGTNATCTCTGATPITRSTIGHTSFPCAHCNDYDPRDISSAADYIERDYADYINATSASGENTRSGVRDSDEPRNFKQTDADSGDSVERRIGIPAGVTI